MGSGIMSEEANSQITVGSLCIQGRSALSKTSWTVGQGENPTL